MRILFLNPGARMGGAETSLIELLTGLRAAQPEWNLHLLVSSDGPLVNKTRALGIPVTILPFPSALARAGEAGARGLSAALLGAGVAAARYAARLSRAIKSIAPDLVHSNGMKMHLLAAAVLRNRIPLVWHMHDYLGGRKLMRRALGLCSSWCSAVIANSMSVACDLRNLNIRAKVVPIYNAIDFARFAPEGSAYDLDRMAGMEAAPAGCLRVGLIATFARWKGQMNFLEAVGRLSSAENFRAYIVGGPIYETAGSQFAMDELREAADLLCPGKIALTGLVDDAAMAIRALDIVVHASTMPEPFGMVIVEAMACGKPVIVSRTGGAMELFEDGVTAIGHVSGDSASLACEISRLMNDATLRRDIGCAARNAVRPRFDRSRIAGEVAEVYRGSYRGGNTAESNSRRVAVA